MPITRIKGYDIETTTFEEKVETAVTNGSVKDDVVNITGDTMTGTLGVPEINITSVNPSDTATLFGSDNNGDSTFHIRIGNGANDMIRIESWNGSAATSLMEIHQDTVNITGNLVVSGTTTTVNSETLEVADNFIILNSGVTGSPTLDAGIKIERGTETDAEFKWNETEDKWEASGGLIVDGDIIGPNLKSSNGSTYIAVNNDDTIKMYTDSDEVISIDSDGNVLFRVSDDGTTHGVTIKGDKTNSRGYHLVVQGASNPALKGYFGIDTDASTPYLSIEMVEEAVAWRNVVLCNDGGYVGINTASPASLFHVHGGNIRITNATAPFEFQVNAAANDFLSIESPGYGDRLAQIISGTGHMRIKGVYEGDLSNNGARIRGRSAHEFSVNWTGSELQFYIDTTNVKNFIIDHPLDKNKYLVHASVEGPEAGVYYRGTGKLEKGKYIIKLPDYFEALVNSSTISVLLTPIDGFDNLTVKKQNGLKVKNNTILVVSDNISSTQEFDWLVVAERKDVEKLFVEPNKDEIEVIGTPPYTSYRRKSLKL